MKNCLKLILVCIALWGVSNPSVGFAATYYVDFDAGNDSNTGTSAAAPWKTIPGTRNAGDTGYVSASYGGGTISTTNKVQTGTIFKLKSGTTHDSTKGGKILMSSAYYATNASVASPITFERDTTWGSGSVTFNGTGVTLGGGGFGLIHVTVGGLKFDGKTSGGIVIRNSAYCGISGYPNPAVETEGISAYYIDFINNGTAYTLPTQNASDGQFRLRYHRGGVLDHCNFDGGGHGYQAVSLADDYKVTGYTVSNCVAYNHSGTDAGDGGIAFKSQNSQVTFINCTAHNNSKGFDLGQNGSWDHSLNIIYKVINCTSYNNDFGVNFSGYGLEGTDYTGTMSFYIINSLIYKNSSFGSKVYGGPFSLYVVNSVYDGNGSANLVAHNDGPNDLYTSHVYVYNSVFYKPSGGGNGNVSHLYWYEVTPPRLVVHEDYNSYIQNSSEPSKQFGGYGNGSTVYTFYYGPNGPGYTSGSWYDFRSWHNDANSLGTGAADTSLPPFASLAGNNYTLTAPYPGMNLRSQPWYIPEMGTDRNGNPRTSWSIGAYEYDGGALKTPNAPSQLGILL